MQSPQGHRTILGGFIMRASKLVLLTICCWLAIAAGSSLYGQATGSLLGTVTDSTGAVVPVRR